MEAHQPPPVLVSARVIAYVIVDDQIEYTGRTLVVVDGQPLGRVPRLAIAEGLAERRDILLLHCDDSWNVLATVGVDTLEEGRSRT